MVDLLSQPEVEVSMQDVRDRFWCELRRQVPNIPAIKAKLTEVADSATDLTCIELRTLITAYEGVARELRKELKSR